MGLAVKYTPPPTKDIEKVIERATKMARDMLEVEFKLQIGEKDPSVMKFFVFSESGHCYPLWGNCFGKPQPHPLLDDKDQLIIVVKIMVRALNSRVVMQIAEVWGAPAECHQCGKEYPLGKQTIEPDWKCECGQPRCQPSQHPKRMERLMAAISTHKDHNIIDGKIIFYNIERDAEGKISGFKFDAEHDCGLTGRMMEWWSFSNSEAPHFMVNYPVFCDALGVVCDDHFREAQRLVMATAPKGYPLLHWGMHDNVGAVLEKLRMDGVDVPDLDV